MSIPKPVLHQWSRVHPRNARSFGTGLINHTYLVDVDELPGLPDLPDLPDAFDEHPLQRNMVLQRLHPVFAASVNHDIDAVTRHVQKKGMVTPRIVPTDGGALYVIDDDEKPWRALTYVRGHSIDRVDSSARAFAAGALVARFHAAVADLSYSYQHVRPGVHDMQKHRGHLDRALREHGAHRLFEAVKTTANDIFRAIPTLPDFSSLPVRHSHGDLKISNLLFDDVGNGVCLVDLDTVGQMIWPYEMGDALRSWCNPKGEDVSQTSVDENIFSQAVHGYFSMGTTVSDDEVAALVAGVAAICMELSMRFLADALFESYFGYNAKKFPARGEHNLLRAQGQWALAQSVFGARKKLEDIVLKAARRM